MARRGRNSKFTAETAAAFCKHVASGVTRKQAAFLIGIDPATIYRWLARSRKRNPGCIFASFVTEVACAEAQFVAQNLRPVVQAAHQRKVRSVKTVTRPDGNSTIEVIEQEASNWAAARWLLKCKDRETFGTHRHEIATLRNELTALRKLLGG